MSDSFGGFLLLFFNSHLLDRHAKYIFVFLTYGLALKFLHAKNRKARRAYAENTALGS